MYLTATTTALALVSCGLVASIAYIAADNSPHGESAPPRRRPARSPTLLPGLALAAGLLASPPVGASDAGGVPEFDPTQDVTLDLERGSERPDHASVAEAFEGQFGAFDACVSKAKRGDDHRIPGDVSVEVLLDPDGSTPLGVNATLPKNVSRRRGLQQCLRRAVAAADYPAYDGPPTVFEFSFELDPGFEDEQ